MPTGLLNSSARVRVWNEAMRCLRKGRRADALRLFTTLADDGYDEALHRIGYIYETSGGGVTRDLDKSIACYARLLERLDDSNARVRIAWAYFVRNQNPDDLRDAYRYLLPLADSKHMEAHYYLGMFYRMGLGVTGNRSKAIQHYTRASELGHPLAMKALSRMIIREQPFLGLRLALGSVWNTIIRSRHRKHIG